MSVSIKALAPLVFSGTLVIAGISSVFGNVMVAETDSDSTNTAYAVSSSDQIEGMLPLAGSTLSTAAGAEGTNSSASVLTDGVFGDPGGPGDPNGYGDAYAIGNGTDLFYSLGSNPLGYDVTNISTYASWGDPGRINQDYTVRYFQASAPTMPQTLTSVAYDTGSGYPNPSTMVSLDITGLTNVTELEFYFPTTQNGDVGYRELDVTASVSVPEPATISLVGIAAVGLLIRRKRLF